MRRLLLATLLLSCSGILSCDTTDYDADPKKDYSEAKNPLDPSSGVNVYLGSLEAVINREKLLFVNGRYSITEIKISDDEVILVRDFSTFAKNDPVFQRNFTGVINEDTYQKLNDGAYPKEGGWEFTYNVADTSVKNRLLFHKYMPAPGKYFKFVVVAQDGPHMRGKFDGVLYRAILAEDKVTPTGEFDLSDSVVIKEAEYYFPKQ